MSSREQPRLVPTEWVKGEPMAYKCSLRCQIFLLPDDRSPKEAVVQLHAAFHEHIGEEHGDEARD